jgi:choline-sulfatase
MIKRRDFLKVSGAAVAASGFLSISKLQNLYAENNSPVNSKRPNILFIITDQQFAGAMSCAGNKYLETPAIDSIAKNGVVFEQSYCSQPLCVPSRTSMFTGLMPHETGVTFNMDQHKISVKMMGAILSEAGYDCGYVGKWHLPVLPDEKEKHGFQTVKYVRHNRLDKHVPTASAEFIQKKREQPFLLVASFMNPHDICEWARGEEGKEGPIPGAPLPAQCPPLPENFEIPANEPDIIRSIQTKSHRTYPTIEWPEDKWRQYRWAYYRFIEKVDAQIGIILEKLRESGQEENTVIIFASDHGDGTGAHRWNQKQVLYEESVRVPFIVSFKGITKAGHVDRNHLVSTGLDLIPTMCDYAGIIPPKSFCGKSVRPLAEERNPTSWRDFLVTETEFCAWEESYGITGRMLRTKRYKYIIYSAGDLREQLFDMEHDPGEMFNLVGSSEHNAVLTEHRNLLAAWCKQTNDSFIMQSEQ